MRKDCDSCIQGNRGEWLEKQEDGQKKKRREREEKESTAASIEIE